MIKRDAGAYSKSVSVHETILSRDVQIPHIVPHARPYGRAYYGADSAVERNEPVARRPTDVVVDVAF